MPSIFSFFICFYFPLVSYFFILYCSLGNSSHPLHPFSPLLCLVIFLPPQLFLLFDHPSSSLSLLSVFSSFAQCVSPFSLLIPFTLASVFIPSLPPPPLFCPFLLFHLLSLSVLSLSFISPFFFCLLPLTFGFVFMSPFSPFSYSFPLFLSFFVLFSSISNFPTSFLFLCLVLLTYI